MKSSNSNGESSVDLTNSSDKDVKLLLSVEDYEASHLCRYLNCVNANHLCVDKKVSSMDRKVCNIQVS